MGSWLPTLVRRGRMAVSVLALLVTAPLGEASPKLAAAADLRGSATTSKRTVVVELSEEPSSAAYDRIVGAIAEPKEADRRAAREAARLQAVRVQRQQDRLAAVLSEAPFKADLIYRSERTSNRLAFHIDSSHVARVRGLPGVRSVQVLP